MQNLDRPEKFEKIVRNSLGQVSRIKSVTDRAFAIILIWMECIDEKVKKKYQYLIEYLSGLWYLYNMNVYLKQCEIPSGVLRIHRGSIDI